MAEFFLDLFQQGLAPSTIEGYRSAIAHTYRSVNKWNVGSNVELTALIGNFYREKPKTRPTPPEWDLAFVLHTLSEPPYEPLAMASLEHLTLKTVFLLAFASGRRRGEIHALQVKGFERPPDWSSVTLHTSPDFVAKTHVPRFGTQSMQPLTIPALSRILGPEMTEDKVLCPVRALRYYIDRTVKIRESRNRLFIAYKKGHKGDIMVTTLAGWLKKVVVRAYTSPSANATKLFLQPHAHQLRGLAASWATVGNVSVEDIMKACHWKQPTTFTTHYLSDLTALREGMFTLGPVVAAQSVVTTSVTHRTS